jgi:hypothetical protein
LNGCEEESLITRRRKTEWFVERDGEVRGPYTKEKLQAFARRGVIRPGDSVRQGARGNPISASDVTGLFPFTSTRSDGPLAEPASKPQVVNEPSVDREPLSAVTPVAKAALLAGAREERRRIAQVSLPQLYLELGKAIHSAPEYQNAFPRLCAEIDESFHRVRALKRARPAARSRSNGRPISAVGNSRNAGAAAAILEKLSGQFRSMGKSAYERDGLASGPSASDDY